MGRDRADGLKKAAGLWGAAEQVLLAVLVCGMVLLSGLQIILRNFFHTGLPWAESVLGPALLWMTMLGALAATGRCKHISVDLASQLLPRRPLEVARAITNLFAAVVCGYLAVAGVRFVLFQQELGGPAAPALAPWAKYASIPACFALLAARFALHALLAGIRAATGRPAEDVQP